MTPTEKAIRDFCGHHADWWPSTTQIQEMLALAQPEQEPVACIWEKNDGYKSLEWGGLDANEIQEIGLKSYTPLYTHPPQRTWVGLTDEEIFELFGRIGTSNSDINPYALIHDARKIEAKLKEKNT
jgi:hypothetical protein